MTVPERMCSGLKTRDGREIPLQGVRIDARLSGACSEVTVTHRYENREKVDVETVYVFPLEEGAAVSGFRARVGNRNIEGYVEKRERAFEVYDEAMADGHGAFLLDQERPNIFTASVGNLRAGQSAEVSITYVALLNHEGEAVRFSLPTTVSPRYVPTGAPEVVQRDGERVNPEVWFDVPYGLTLTVEVVSGSAIRSIESPSHHIRTDLDGGAATVTLATRENRLDRDFVLLVETKEAHQPCATVAREEDGTRVVMVTFAPGEDVLRQAEACEIQFVLDCSWSMSGSSISEAKQALELCARAMSEGDTFNIIPFGSDFETMWDEPRPYNQQNLDEAVAFIRSLDADMGGTEIRQPMAHVLKQPADNERPRQLVLLTDGQVANEADVIALCREEAATARVFAFGIGHGASEHLVRGVARESRGAAELICPGERIEAKVLRMFSRVRTPALTEVKMDWGGLTVDQAPSSVPPVFGGDSLTLFARVRSGLADTLVLRGDDKEWTIAVDLERVESGGPIPTLWARHRIRNLETSQGGTRGSNQSGRKSQGRLVDQIVELGKRYGLMSQHTSYVAVEERADADKTTEQAQLRRIPVTLTRGWGGGRGQATTRSAVRSIAAASSVVSTAASLVSQLFGSTSGSHGMSAALAPSSAGWDHGGDEEPLFLRKLSTGASPRERRTETADLSAPYPTDRLYDLLLTQRANGTFLLTPALESWLGDRARRVRKEVEKRDEALVATAVVVALVAAEMADRREEWKMAMEKAKKWLAKQAEQIDGGKLI